MPVSNEVRRPIESKEFGSSLNFSDNGQGNCNSNVNSSSSFLTGSLDASFTPRESDAFSAFSPNPAQNSASMRNFRERLSFSGFPTSLDNIVSIEAFEDDSIMDGRRSSMLVRVRGRFSEKRKQNQLGHGRKGGNAAATPGSALRRAGRNRKPLGKLFDANEMQDDEDAENIFGRSNHAKNSSSPCKVEEIYDEDDDEDEDDEEEEEELIVASEGLRETAIERVQGNRRGAMKALTDRPSSRAACSDENGNNRRTVEEVAPLEVRIEDKELVAFCGVVLNLLHQELESSHDRDDEDYQLETLPKLREAFNNLVACSEVPAWLSQKAREIKHDVELQMSANGSVLESSLASSSLEVIQEDCKSEFPSATTSNSSSSAGSASSCSSAVERVGMASFVKQCVQAITILKSKIDRDKATIARIQEENIQSTMLAKEQARKETEEEWRRRCSMVRRETERKTKAELEREQEDRMKEAIQRVRAEAESDWQARLREEQKNRRLSAQVKMTLAVERVSKQAEFDKRQALSALAEELEQEKEEATRNAANLARKTAEMEWERKLQLGIREAKDEILKQIKSETMQQQQHQQHHQQQHMQMQHMEEQTVWVEQAHEIRRYSAHHVEQQGSTSSSARSSASFQGSQQMRVDQCVVMRNSTGRMMRNSTGRIMQSVSASDFSNDHCLPSPISMMSMPLDDSMPQRSSTGNRLLSPGLRRVSGRASDSTPIAHRRKLTAPKSGSRRSSPLHAQQQIRDRSSNDAASISSRNETTLHRSGTSASRRSSASSHSNRDNTKNKSLSTPVRRGSKSSLGASSPETPQNQKRESSVATTPSPRASRRMITSPGGNPLFDLIDLSVRPGELKGSALAGRYREYDVCAVVAVYHATKGKQELRTRRSLRYSAARELFHDRLFIEAESFGFQHSFQSVLATFPPKAMGNSNSDATAKLRAKSIQTYLLTAYDTCARLLRITKDDQDRKDLHALTTAVFADFLS